MPGTGSSASTQSFVAPTGLFPPALLFHDEVHGVILMVCRLMSRLGQEIMYVHRECPASDLQLSA